MGGQELHGAVCATGEERQKDQREDDGTQGQEDCRSKDGNHENPLASTQGAG